MQTGALCEVLVAAKATSKSKAWALFDHILSSAAPSGVHSNPWTTAVGGQLHFEPDYDTLEGLLGVPLYLRATTQSGVPALALDVWLSYELRRAGFGIDQVWPRPSNPRILPSSVAALIASLPKQLREAVRGRVEKASSIKGVTANSATILGKNYLKQVDVIITDWPTGPELLVSTKRMDSSYGKNAPNRIEESYGDAKNLRLRHPLAALGFMFGLRSDILTKEPNTAEWLFDLLTKLGREDDAYHATCLVLMEYADEAALPEGDEEPKAGILEPGPEPEEDEDEEVVTLPGSEIDEVMRRLPKVVVRRDLTPDELAPGRFLAILVARILEITPVNMHVEARRRRAAVASP